MASTALFICLSKRLGAIRLDGRLVHWSVGSMERGRAAAPRAENLLIEDARAASAGTTASDRSRRRCSNVAIGAPRELMTHLSLTKDAPIPRDGQRVGRVLSCADYTIAKSGSEIRDKDRQARGVVPARCAICQ
jgi:hypothetical protein